jgi:hypothetical protein
MFSKDKQRTLALGNRVLLQCAAPREWTQGKLRSGLTFSGITLLVAALMVLVAAVTEHWWIDLALSVLGLGGITSALALGWLKLRPAAD